VEEEDERERAVSEAHAGGAFVSAMSTATAISRHRADEHEGEDDTVSRVKITGEGDDSDGDDAESVATNLVDVSGFDTASRAGDGRVGRLVRGAQLPF
jgi:hypothetical protein